MYTLIAPSDSSYSFSTGNPIDVVAFMPSDAGSAMQSPVEMYTRSKKWRPKPGTCTYFVTPDTTWFDSMRGASTT